MLSSNKDFNLLLASIVPQNRKEELANEEFYLYTATTYKKMQDFLYRIKQIEKGIRVEMIEMTEEEIFEQELEDLKRELLNYQEDTALLRKLEERDMQDAPVKKKGKKEQISFVDEEETIPQEQPYDAPPSFQDIQRFLNEGADPVQTPPQQDDKGKKKKVKEEIPEEEEDPYADDDKPEPVETPKQQPADEEKSDFEQIMGGDEKKKKKKGE